MLACAVGAAILWWPAVVLAWRKLNLKLSMTAYMKVVNRYEEMSRNGVIGDETLAEKGGKTRIDPGPPVRIAFVEVVEEGTWAGYVYDPTGLVRQVGLLREEADRAGRPFDNRAAAENDPDLAELIMLFGGAMADCKHLQGHWYWCEFN